MVDFKADLHTHTTHSDGTKSPKELLDIAHEAGLSGLSITDHDTISAYREAAPYAKTLGIKLLPGVELSAQHKNTSVHILGYAFDENNKLIDQFCKDYYEIRKQRNAEILELLAKNGMFISNEDVQNECLGTPGRPHIASVMLKKGYVKTFRDAFNLYIGDGKPCFVQGNRFSVEETIHHIHAAKGLAVIAHPHQIKSRKVVQDLLRMDFDGIEGHYGCLMAHEERKWIAIGRQKGWIVTGGSDFHGEIKPHNSIGASWVDEDTFQSLYLHYLNNHA